MEGHKDKKDKKHKKDEHEKHKLDEKLHQLFKDTGISFHDHTSPENGDAAWSQLKQGNERFVHGDLVSYFGNIARDVSAEARKKLTVGQHPFAIILTCSDSRVSPELIFDQGLGQVFVIRVAGNVVDEVLTGSIEYAAEHLHSPLLLIMGHTACGAVTAALSAGSMEGNIGEILKRIQPAVELAKSQCADEAGCLPLAIAANVHESKKALLATSATIKHLHESSALKIVTAVYHLDTGVVEELNE